MTAAVREWLPIEACLNPAVRLALAEALGAWSSLWFSRREMRIASLSALPGAARNLGEDAAWRVYGNGIAVSHPHRFTGKLSGLALDFDAGAVQFNSADRAVLLDFENRVLEDLAVRLEKAFGIVAESAKDPRAVADPFNGRGGLIAGVADESAGLLLTVAAPHDIVSAFSRSALMASAARPATLSNLTNALSAVEVAVQISIGSATTSFGSMNGLGVGDILVLDTPFASPPHVSLLSNGCLIGEAALTADDGQLSLVMQRLH